MFISTSIMGIRVSLHDPGDLTRGDVAGWFSTLRCRVLEIYTHSLVLQNTSRGTLENTNGIGNGWRLEALSRLRGTILTWGRR